MSSLASGYAFALGTALIVIIGDFVLKLAADAGHTITSGYVLAGVAIYGVSALFWFWAMQNMTLAQAGVAYSMITLIALAAIGSVWFKEPLYTREYAGLGCALLAMILMSRSA